MQVKPGFLRVLVSVLICSMLLATIASIVFAARENLADSALADQGIKTHRIQLRPVLLRYDPILIKRVTNANAGAQPMRFACQSNDDPQPSLCYGPHQLREAYGVNDLITKQGITGKGTSITIIDAYGSPNIHKDLKVFDATWSLPDPQLNIITPYGVDGEDSSWISETSLDVEWAHVMAPEATINLVVARDSNDYSIYKALSYAVKHNLGDVISLSFGESEHCVDPQLRQDEHRIFVEAASKGMTLVAATGDFGSAQLACDGGSFEKAISFPTDDPLVTAVGGTALIADAVTGRYTRETTWNESAAYNKATGGGYSKIYRAPAFQRGLVPRGAGRAVPDISLNASVNGGVIVFESHHTEEHPIINIMGGTSAAAPELAGLFADGVQMAHHRLGTLNPAIYRLGTGPSYSQLMHDITYGDNVLLSSGLNGYTAGTGWDAVTGWGSPRDAGQFLSALIAANQEIAPIAGSPTSSNRQPPASPVPGTLTPIVTVTPTPNLPISPVSTPDLQRPVSSIMPALPVKPVSSMTPAPSATPRPPAVRASKNEPGLSARKPEGIHDKQSIARR